MEVNIRQLREVTDKIFSHLLEDGVEKLDLTADYYWQIPREFLYDKYDEPKSFTMGQLSEDLTFVEEIREGVRSPVAYGLVWIASLLRYIGEEIVK